MRCATALAYPVCRLSLAMSVQFTFEMCVTVENCKKSFKTLKTPHLKGSRTFKVIDVDTIKSSSLVLVMITVCLCLSATVFTLTSQYQ